MPKLCAVHVLPSSPSQLPPCLESAEKSISVDDTTVSVKGNLYCGMPKEFGDDLWMYALRQQQGRARMAQVVEPSVLRQMNTLITDAFTGYSTRSATAIPQSTVKLHCPQYSRKG
jgi:hypothetical protein